MPANAYLNTAGDAWTCERGYRAAGETCRAVDVPAHGYFVDTPYGTSWKCKRGYQVRNDTCVAVALPRNAHLDFSGNGWACDQPYRLRTDGCVLP